jgi:anti-sigma factor RsiW
MKCRVVKKKLSAYQDGELKDREQKEVACHLADCQDCQKQYAQLERIRQALGEWEEILPDPWFSRQVVGRIGVSREHRLWPTFSPVLQLLRTPVMASILLIIGITAGGYFGTTVARSGLFPLQQHPASYAQAESLFNTLRFFDPAPPGTFADGYLRMASYKEVYK